MNTPQHLEKIERQKSGQVMEVFDIVVLMVPSAGIEDRAFLIKGRNDGKHSRIAGGFRRHHGADASQEAADGCTGEPSDAIWVRSPSSTPVSPDERIVLAELAPDDGVEATESESGFIYEALEDVRDISGQFNLASLHRLG